MANPVTESSGTQTSVVTTEHTLRDVATAQTSVLTVDLGVMVDGDIVEIRCYEAVLSSGTLRLLDIWHFYGASPLGWGAQKIWVSPGIPNINTDAASIRWTLKQTFGTSRNFAWQAFKYT